MSTEMSAFDVNIRQRLYDGVINTGRLPLVAQLVEDTASSQAAVAGALQRLHETHTIVLQRESSEVLMANPFSAVPTPFVVASGDDSWYANCIWDAMGIAAMLHRDAVIRTSCGCCGSRIDLAVPQECQDGAQMVAHFAIPAARWWNDIVFN